MRIGEALIGGDTGQNIVVLFRDAATPTQGLDSVNYAQISGTIHRIGDPTNNVTWAAGGLTQYADNSGLPHVGLAFRDLGNGIGILGLPDSVLARGKSGDANFLPSEIVVHLDLTGTTEYQFHKSFPVTDVQDFFWRLALTDYLTRNGRTIPEQSMYVGLLSQTQEVDGDTDPGTQTLKNEAGAATGIGTLNAIFG